MPDYPLTAQKVIEMFAELDLLVCDDDNAIKGRFEVKKPYYEELAKDSHPDIRAKGEVGLKNGMILKNQRSELLKAVYEHFIDEADLRVDTEKASGRTKVDSLLIDILIRILREDCHVDRELAKQFLNRYLDERGFKLGKYIVRPVSAKILLQIFKANVWQVLEVFGKPPRYDEFKLPPPPTRVPKIWHICHRGDPRKPTPIELPGIGQIWLLGWLAPGIPHMARPAGVDLWVNGKPICYGDEVLVPDRTPELAGAVSCISNSRTDLDPEAMGRLKEKVSELIKSEINQWLPKVDDHTYDRVFQPMVPLSGRMHDLLVVQRRRDYWNLARSFHKFMTNKGEMTLGELLKAHEHEPRMVLHATIGLHPHNRLLTGISEKCIIVDLSGFYVRAFFREVVEAAGGRIRFVDDFGSLRDLVEKANLCECEHALKRWLEDFFSRSEHLRGVQVAICHPEGLHGLPATIVPRIGPEASPSQGINLKELDHRWIRASSTILLSADSKLLKHLKSLKGLPPGSEVKERIPSLVFRYVASFGLERPFPDYQPEYQEEQWNDFTHHLEMIVNIACELAAGTLSPAEKRRLEDKLQETQRELEIALGQMGELYKE